MNTLHSFLMPCRQIHDYDAWQQAGQETALCLFHEAARRVPAYRHFLAEHSINPDAVRTWQDFSRLPPTEKANYIDRYPLEQLVWDGDLSRAVVLNGSSGTTGTSYFWPFDSEEIEQSAQLYEFLFRSYFELDQHKTLLVICFGMGVWIAGSYTFLASQNIGCKGHDLTVVTPGFDKAETLRVLIDLAPKFEQVIIAGIPSFIKDLVDAWVQSNQPLPQVIRYFLAGEGFSERWRDYIRTQTRAANVLSFLGSAEGGLMAFETALTQQVRSCATDAEVRTGLFGLDRLPALFRYIPTHRFFEAHNGELLITARRALPLIRYNLHDEGGILSPETVQSIFGNTPPFADAEPATGLPLLYVFGRGRFGTLFYGLTMYPEDVQSLLLHPQASQYVSGRFTLSSGHSDTLDPRLQIDVELAECQEPEWDLAARLVELYVSLTRQSRSEYDRICQEYNAKAWPHVVLHRYGAEPLFPRGTLRKIT
jgi:phenylacetate-CoA ligase